MPRPLLNVRFPTWPPAIDWPKDWGDGNARKLPLSAISAITPAGQLLMQVQEEAHHGAEVVQSGAV